MKVYLDNSATTFQHKTVTEAVYQWGIRKSANPSSLHGFGREAKAELETVRDKLAVRLGCQSKELIFTSGGTEANNLAIFGCLKALKIDQPHLIVSAIEHPSVLQIAKELENSGVEVDYVYPDSNGIVHPVNIEKLIKINTVLVSVMHANNETGVIQPIKDIAGLCNQKGILYHCDAVQSFGKIPFDLADIKVDLLSLSAHKIYGPKGVGALFIRESVPFTTDRFGGGQEANRRPGTENLPGIIGFGAAADMINYDKDYVLVKDKRAYFEHQVKQNFPYSRINAEAAERSAYISNIAFPGIDNEALLLNLDLAGIAVSVGSACSSGTIKQSHVLEAMGLDNEIINGSLRFSYSPLTTKEELDYTLEQLELITKRLRKTI